MSEPSTYTLPPRRTIEEAMALEAFIRARVTPLRNAARTGTDEYKAFQALLDLCTVTLGGAGAAAKAGDSIDAMYFYLYSAASQWRRHPDFLPGWNR